MSCGVSLCIFPPTIMVDGQIVGIWRRTFQKRVGGHHAEPMLAGKAERRAYTAAACQYAFRMTTRVCSQSYMARRTNRSAAS
jgi:hypothetical protein